jgi:polygalacturonase
VRLLAEGATLCFDTNPASYPLGFTRWEDVELMNYSPLISNTPLSRRTSPSPARARSMGRDAQGTGGVERQMGWHDRSWLG